MPLVQSDTQAATEDNFREFGKGKTYRRTKRKYGKKRADRQRIAVVLSNKRKAKGKKVGKKRSAKATRKKRKVSKHYVATKRA
jgi:hypothetical protein